MSDKKDGTSGTPVFSNIMNKVSSSLGSANESVKSGVSSVTQSVGSTVSKGSEVVQQVATAYGLIILVTVVIAIILFIIAYYLYRYMSTRLVNKLNIEIEGTSSPIKTNKLNKVIPTGGLPTADNGRRFSYLFWIYIYDLSKFTQSESLRHVLSIGGSDTNVGAGATPSIFLDGIKNKLYIRFKKTGTDTSSLNDRVKTIKDFTYGDFTNKGSSYANDNIKKAIFDEVSSLVGTIDMNTAVGASPDKNPFTFDDAIKIDLARNGAIIDYVPLQRWVHVAVVFNETVNTGLITIYLDAEVVKTISTDTYYNLSVDSKSIPVNLTNIDPEPEGTIYIGSDDVSSVMGFSGLVSKVRIANYDLNAKEIKDIYIKGPVDNLAGMFGLPPYGLRSPIYRIGGNQDVSDL